MVRQSGEASKSSALNVSRKRTRVEATEPQAEVEDDVSQSVQRFFDAVARNPDRVKKAMAEQNPNVTPLVEEGETPVGTLHTPESNVGYVNKKFDMVDPTQKYVVLSAVGRDVANKAYNEKNELIDYNGLVVWGCVDSLESEEFKDMQRRAAASCKNEFHVLAMPTCSMVPLKFSEEELRNVKNRTWQDDRVQVLMDGHQRSIANGQVAFQQYKEARSKGQTTPEMIREQLEHLQRDREKVRLEALEMEQHIKELQDKLQLAPNV